MDERQERQPEAGVEAPAEDSKLALQFPGGTLKRFCLAPFISSLNRLDHARFILEFNLFF